MAGDWIKMRAGLGSDPRVVTIASRCRHGVTVTNVQLKLLVVGALHALWSIADEFSTDGFLLGYGESEVDELAGLDGFCAALAFVGWVAIRQDGLQIVDFERHNGASAKQRAVDARRQAKQRDAQVSRLRHGGTVTDRGRMNGSSHGGTVTKLGPREERERESLPPLTPPSPPGGAAALGPRPLADPGPALPEDPPGASSSPPRGDTPRTPTRDEGGAPEPPGGPAPPAASDPPAARPEGAVQTAGEAERGALPAVTSAAAAWQQVLDLRAWTARRAAPPRVPAKGEPWLVPVSAEDPCPICAATEGCAVGARGGLREHLVAFCRQVDRGEQAGEDWSSMGPIELGASGRAWAWRRRSAGVGSLLELCGPRPSGAQPPAEPQRVAIDREVRELATKLFGAAWESTPWAQATEVANRGAFMREWRARDSARASRRAS